MYLRIHTRLVACHEHLTTDQRDLDVVNPDLVSTIQRDGVATPDVFRVDIGDVDVLDDHVARTARQTKTLPADDTSAAHTNNGLVRADIHAFGSRLVIGASDIGRAAAPAKGGLNGILTGAATGVGAGDAAGAVGTGAFTPGEIKLLVDQDNARRIIRQPLGQFFDVTGSGWSGVPTTGGARGKAERLPYNTLGVRRRA